MLDLIQLQPKDEHNQRLESNVHPPNWSNPEPAGRYNLVVIGGGTAGLVTASGAAGLGARVALIERDLLGGDCLNVGCVPSKAIISSARIAAAVRHASQFGVCVPEKAEVDFGKVMERMRRLRADISPHDSAARFRDLGIDVFLGEGRFKDRQTVEVDGVELSFKKAVLATGARASAPPIPGLDQVEYLTNESVFSLTRLPRRFAVIGAGPIGCELAQSFARFGSQVFLIEAMHGILPKEDEEAAAIVRDSMLRDGVQLLCCGKKTEVRKTGDGIGISLNSHERQYDITVDELLIAVGRAPNLEGLNLEAAGVEYDRQGVKVDDRLRTSNRRIYAAGDICTPYKFTHAADFMARIVIQNALFLGRSRMSRLRIPWSTYTSPEIAHIGLYEREAEEQGIEIDTYVQKLDGVDRAVLEEETEGFVKVHTRKGSDEILGATVVATNAGDLISELTLAINNRLGLSKVGSSIHPYPTQAEAIRKLGDAYSRTRLTPFVKTIFSKWLSWTR